MNALILLSFKGHKWRHTNITGFSSICQNEACLTVFTVFIFTYCVKNYSTLIVENPMKNWKKDIEVELILRDCYARFAAQSLLWQLPFTRSIRSQSDEVWRQFVVEHDHSVLSHADPWKICQVCFHNQTNVVLLLNGWWQELILSLVWANDIYTILMHRPLSDVMCPLLSSQTNLVFGHFL